MAKVWFEWNREIMRLERKARSDFMRPLPGRWPNFSKLDLPWKARSSWIAETTGNASGLFAEFKLEGKVSKVLEIRFRPVLWRPLVASLELISDCLETIRRRRAIYSRKSPTSSSTVRAEIGTGRTDFSSRPGRRF